MVSSGFTRFTSCRVEHTTQHSRISTFLAFLPPTTVRATKLRSAHDTITFARMIDAMLEAEILGETNTARVFLLVVFARPLHLLRCRRAFGGSAENMLASRLGIWRDTG